METLKAMIAAIVIFGVWLSAASSLGPRDRQHRDSRSPALHSQSSSCGSAHDDRTDRSSDEFRIHGDLK